MKTKHMHSCPVCGSKGFVSFLTCEDYFATRETFDILCCKACGFAFTQDFPSEDEIGKYYDAPSYISHSDTNKGLINILYHFARKIALRSKSKVVLKYSSHSPGKLLDIGSGTGYFLNKMKKLKWIVTGIEKSEAARKMAKQKFDIYTQDSEYLYDLNCKTKDVITMWHVLEHLEHLNAVMEHLQTILQDDGTVIIALPNKDSFDAAHYKQYWAAYDVPRHLWHFSPADFNRLAVKHHYEVIDIKPMYFDAFYISMLSEKNKGTFLASVVGLVKGGAFFLRSLCNKERCSSLTYILKKKQTNNTI